MSKNTNTIRGSRKHPLAFGLVALAATVALLSGCGDKKEKLASQTAVKVNKDEITVHQINFVLQQQRGLRAEQAEAAGRQVLERLIDQQLAIEKADDLKLDREPRVVQQLEAAKREILARAYFDRVSEGAAKPSREDIKKYYDDTPALFKERRVYQMQELAIEASPESVGALRAKLTASKNIGEFIEYLKSQDIKFAANQAVRTAEQLPLQSLERFSQMKDGQALVNQSPKGLQVIVLVNSRNQPVTEEQAKPAIEQFLLNERRRKLVTDDLKAMRTAAKIEYVGKYKEPMPATAAAAASDSQVPSIGADAASASGQDATLTATKPVSATPGAPAASSGMSAADISKGMGLK